MIDQTFGDTTAPPLVRADGEILGVPRRVALPLVLMLLVAGIAYTAWWGSTPHIAGDTSSYQQVAAEIRSAGTIDRLQYRTPGYPAILLLTGSVDQLSTMLYLLQILGHMIVVWMTVALAQRFSLSRFGSLGLSLLLLSPPLMEKIAQGLTEAACELFITATVLFLVRWTEQQRTIDGLLAGASVAIAALIRPSYQLLGVLFAVGFGVWIWRTGDSRRALRTSLSIVAGSVLVVGGVTLLNATRFGYPGFSPGVGWNLSTKTALFVESLPDEDARLRDVLVEQRDHDLVDGESHSGVMYIWGIRPEVAAATGMDGPELDRYMVESNVRLIAANPLNYIAAVGAASADYVMPSTTELATGGRKSLQVLFAAGHFLVLLGFLVQIVCYFGMIIAKHLGAIVRGAFADDRARRTWWLAMTVITYTWLVSVFVEVGNPRYRTPIDPLILLVVFGGLSMTAVAFKTSSRRIGQNRVEAQERP